MDSPFPKDTCQTWQTCRWSRGQSCTADEMHAHSRNGGTSLIFWNEWVDGFKIHVNDERCSWYSSRMVRVEPRWLVVVWISVNKVLEPDVVVGLIGLVGWGRGRECLLAIFNCEKEKKRLPIIIVVASIAIRHIFESCTTVKHRVLGSQMHNYTKKRTHFGTRHRFLTPRLDNHYWDCLRLYE